MLCCTKCFMFPRYHEGWDVDSCYDTRPLGGRLCLWLNLQYIIYVSHFWSWYISPPVKKRGEMHGKNCANRWYFCLKKVERLWVVKLHIFSSYMYCTCGAVLHMAYRCTCNWPLAMYSEILRVTIKLYKVLIMLLQRQGNRVVVNNNLSDFNKDV